MENVRFRCLGPSILLQFYSVISTFTIFGKVPKIIENRCQNGSQNDPKIDIWAIGVRIFEILGRFLRGLIFDGLLSRGDTAAPHGYSTTVGDVVERKGIGRNWRELADTDKQN